MRGGGKDYRSPAPVVGLKGIKITKVGCGDFHSIALSEDGKLYAWGGGGNFFNRGQCGLGVTKDSESPEIIKALEQKVVVNFSCGGYHTLALSADGNLYAWGAGLYGECGFGAYVNSSTPKQVIFQQKEMPVEVNEDMDEEQKETANKRNSMPQIKDISAGGHHSMVLTGNILLYCLDDGYLYTFGYSAHGQLGLHNTINQCYPQLVKDFSGIKITQIAAGWHHSVVLTEKGDIYTCGHGGTGQLGLGTTEVTPFFSSVTSIGPKNITRIFAGGNHTWATIDYENPDRENYQPPEPLYIPENSPQKSHHFGFSSEDPETQIEGSSRPLCKKIYRNSLFRSFASNFNRSCMLP